MATTGIINGTLVKILIGAVEVDLQTDCSLSETLNMIDITTKDSGGHKEVMAGDDEWEISGSFKVADDSTYGYSELKTAKDAKAAVTVKMSSEVTGDNYYTGSAYISSLSRTSPQGDATTGEFTLTGTGALTEAQVA